MSSYKTIRGKTPGFKRNNMFWAKYRRKMLAL